MSYLVIIIETSKQSFVFYSSLGFIKDKLQATIGECDNGLSQHSLIYFPSAFFVVIYNYIFLPYAQYFFSVEIKTRSKSFFVSYLVYSLNIVVKCAYLGNDFTEYETFFKIIQFLVQLVANKCEGFKTGADLGGGCRRYAPPTPP